MPNINVNTNHPEYQRLLANARELKTALKPYLLRYQSLSKASRARWREKDPFLDGVLTWAERISAGKDE